MTAENLSHVVAAGGPATAAASLSRADALMAAGAALFEAGGLLTATNPLAAVAVHLLTLVALGYRLVNRRRSGGDAAAASLMLIATAAAGPVGTLGSLAAIAVARRQANGDDPALLRDWYERISHSTSVDPVTRLCEQVAAGRALSLSEEPSASFWDMLESSRIEHQQTVLGLVARRFDPKFLPVLGRALTSPIGIIRVQAAAVAARVRHQVEERARQLIGEAAAGGFGSDRIVPLAAELDLYARSSLCDQLVRRKATALVDDLLRRHRPALERALWGPPGSGRRDVADDDRQELFERYLIRSGDFPALRRLRSRQRIAALGRRARVRPLPGPAIAAHGREAAR